MRSKLVIGAAALVALSGIARGEEVLSLREACMTDRETYCADVRPGKGRIVKCLQEHQDQISDQCKNAIGAVRDACEGDIETYCPDVEPGDGRLGNCLREHEERVSEECKNAINRAR